MRQATLLGVSIVLGVAAGATTATAATITQDFTTDPGWTGVGNTTAPNNYGWSSSTNYAGGAIGEAGGIFARRNTKDYYADTANFPTSFDLSSSLSGSGLFDTFDTATRNNINFVGHLSASTEDQSALGLRIMEQNASSVRVSAGIVLGNGTMLASSVVVIPIGAYSFSYTYNPTGGVNSQGQLSLTVSAVGTPFTVDLTAANRSAGATFDAWGLSGFKHSTSDNSYGKVYIDNVTYNASVPEPTGGLVLLLGAGVLGLRRRRSPTLTA